jgi:tetratricopeptide (TPR) repeat protein
VVEDRLLSAARLHPDDFGANHELGEYYLHQNKLDAAIPYLEKAWIADSSQYINGYDLALAELQVHKTSESRSVITALLRRADKADLHNMLADIEESEGHFNEAARQYEIAARMEPTEKNLFDLGSDLTLHGANGPAQKVFEFATKQYPHSAKLRVGLGVAYYSLGLYDNAVESLCQGVDLDPSDTKALFFLGKMYNVSSVFADRVTERLAHFVALYPQNAAANYYYALSLRRRGVAMSTGSNSTAEKLLRTAVRLDPKFAEAHYELAQLYEDESLDSQAIPEYEIYVRLSPDNTKAHYRLARLYQKHQNKVAAAREFRAVEEAKTKQHGQTAPATQ